MRRYLVKISEVLKMDYFTKIEAETKNEAQEKARSCRQNWGEAHVVRHNITAEAEALDDPINISSGSAVMDELEKLGWRSFCDEKDFLLRMVHKKTERGSAQLTYEKAEEYGGHLLVLTWFPKGSKDSWSTLLWKQELWKPSLAAAINRCAEHIDDSYGEFIRGLDGPITGMPD